MRYFPLLGFQHVVLFLFPSLLLIILLYLGLSGVHFRGKNSEERKKTVVHAYPEGIEAKDSPFPLILIMIIIGFLLWAFFYTFVIGLLGVKI